MCIIAVKPSGVDMPSEEIIDTMWSHNYDGAGYMWADNNKVHINKGFMNLASLKESLRRFSKTHDVKTTPVVLHFRIKTDGKINAEQTHPFPITSNPDMLTATTCDTKLAVAHNGIIRNKPKNGMSDTMEYIVDALAKFRAIDKQFYKIDAYKDLIRNYTSWSRFAFLDNTGHIETIGDFIEDNGILYSNSGYKKRTYTTYSAWDDDTDDYYNRAYFSDYLASIVSRKFIDISDNKKYIIRHFYTQKTHDDPVRRAYLGENNRTYIIDDSGKLKCLWCYDVFDKETNKRVLFTDLAKYCEPEEKEVARSEV